MDKRQQKVRKLRAGVLPGIATPGRFIVVALQYIVWENRAEHSRAVQDGIFDGCGGCEQKPDERESTQQPDDAPTPPRHSPVSFKKQHMCTCKESHSSGFDLC